MRVRRRRGGRARRRRAAPCFTRVTSEPRCQARSGCCFCWRSDVRRDCALRLLSRRPDFPFTVLVAATAVINGAGLLQTLVMEMENSLQKTHATA